MFITSFSEWNYKNIILRIFAAMLVGVVIGIDRGAKRRGGGARTTVTVCLGAALVMILEQYMEQLYPGRLDISRMSAQVISGVGFLGAGSILVSGHQIKGLTSAASIWMCACVGLAVGAGFLDGAVIFVAVWLIGVHLAPYIEEKFYSHSRYMALYIEVEDGRAITHVSGLLKESECLADSFYVDKPKAKGQHFQIVTTFKIPKGESRDECLQRIREQKGVISVSEI